MRRAAPWLVGNVGAEEARPGPLHPYAHAVARLLALSLPANGRLLAADTSEPVAAFWPESLGTPASSAAFSWLTEADDHAWLPTEEADALLAKHGRGPLSPPPSTIRAVHDKAFTQRVSNQTQLVPRPLRGLERVFEPAELIAPDALARIETHLNTWPRWTGGRFALKPRFGTSGRGRVPGEHNSIDLDALRGALPRLAERGGAILEPWLEREQDLSVQLHLAKDGSITLLGTLEQRMSAAGVYRGHNGSIDQRGRVTSSTQWDDPLLEAAMELARAASAQGFHGPCGIDAFSFAGPDRTLLRPAVEFNARFTTGTLAIGLVRRALPRVASRIGLAPGAPRYFHFALDAPPGGWPQNEGGNLVVLSLTSALTGTQAALQPALLFARDPEILCAAQGR